MYRGRLEISSPDGPIENFFIEKDVVAIGRSVGNDVVLDRHGISRYHVTLTPKDQQAVIEDLESVNGTYIDGIRLKANEPRILRGGEEIQIGDLRLIYHPAQPLDLTLQTSTQIHEVDTFKVELEGPDIAVTPGIYGAATVRIKNTTAQAERFQIRVEGVPKEWARLDRTEAEIAPDQEVQVGINFKPLRRPETQPGKYPITVTITPQSAPQNAVELSTTLQILQFSGYGAVMGTPVVEGDQSFQMYVHNQGNGPLHLRFSGNSPDATLKFTLHPASVTLGPGQRQTISGTVLPRDRIWLGQPRTYRYTIISHSVDAAAFQAPISGQVRVVPLLPLWAVFVMIPGLLLVGAVALLLLISILGTSDDTETRPPMITQFELSESTVLIDEPVLLSWETQDSDELTIGVWRDGTRFDTYTLSGDVGSGYALNMPSAGRYTLTLTATNGPEETEENRIVLVRPQARLTAQTFPDGEVLYRNLAGQQIIANWEVIWQRSTTDVPPPDVFLNSEALTVDQASIAVGPDTAGRYTVDVPMLETLDPVDLNLLVIGPDDVQTAEPISIAVDYPRCRTSTEVDVFRGPALAYEQAGTLPGNLNVRIDARASNPAWLRIVPSPEDLPGVFFGWVQLDQVDCQDFNPELMKIIPDEELPPLEITEPSPEEEPPQGPDQPGTTEPPSATPTLAPNG